MNYLSQMLLCDFYKIAHREMYPEGTQFVYSTWTPRTSRIDNVVEVVAFGFQAFIQDKLMDSFDANFFNRPKQEVINEYARVIRHTLGVENPPTQHIEELHDLGYLPLIIQAVPEGTRVPIRTPMLTIENTDPRFFWLTNYIETLASCSLWQASTSATIALQYRKLLDEYAALTGADPDFVQFQGHDFSMRGMGSLETAINSGMGHLLSFTGTDTIPAIQAAEHFYGADITKELVGTSIPATEHSVQCAFGNDEEYIRSMIEDVHPEGMVSIVSDGYDFWGVMTEILPKLKESIMCRNGRVVIRPDSGDPVKIICGDPNGETEAERKGAVVVLWETFGGRTNDAGFMELDPHIGLIYGDAITLDRAQEILSRLANLGFASSNIVFGIGSFTYQYNTRDTFGFALKSTNCIINGKETPIFKDPKTDDGTKKSQRGRVWVEQDPITGEISWEDGLSAEDLIDYLIPRLPDLQGVLLEPIWKDGNFLELQTFSDIRDRIQN